jgi:16S rRNA (guanine(1405)-N(7))-methyltransferase
MGDRTEQLSQLVASVQISSKFKNVHPGLIARIGAGELKKERRLKEAVKATKKKLHQVGSAYQLSRNDYQAWLSSLRESANDLDQFKAACLEIMDHNRSTQERLPIIVDFYSEIFAHLPPINSVLDVACGFNPLAIPWMDLEENASYTAVDIYKDMTNFIGEYLELMPVQGKAMLCDVITELPGERFDLAIMLKAMPCLEQLDKGAGGLILENLNAKHILVSYPIYSLGGKAKGMLENYQRQFYEMVDGKGWNIQKFEFLTELAFLVEK